LAALTRTRDDGERRRTDLHQQRRESNAALTLTNAGRQSPQNASVGWWTPQTSRRTVQTSPTVARARRASCIG
jgi:hypothetical protein